MHLTVQCTASCRACGHDTTPINAAVRAVFCQGCGADLKLPDALWEAALTSIAYAAADLPENGRLHDTHQHRGATLRIAAIRATPTCPHCSTTWSSLPAAGPWSCPGCSIDIPIRESPVAVDDIVALIAEDRGLLGDDGEPFEVMLRCSGCGAPLDTGTERRVSCGSCDAQTVVPDEVYRRVNAPELTASWIIAVADGVQAHPLTGVTVSHLACAGDGVLYIVGGTGQLDFALVAVDAESKGVLWMLDLGGEGWPNLAVLDDGRVALSQELESEVRFASKDGIEPGFSTEPLINDLCAHDGQLVLCTHPLRALERRTLGGQVVPMWPPVGWMARLLGRGDTTSLTEAPCRRPAAMFPGRLGVGQDGDLRMTWGHHLARYSRAGDLLMSVKLPGISIHSPAAAPDGTAFAVVATDGRSQLLRIGSDSKVTVVIEADHLTGCTCDTKGRVWTYGGDHEDGVGGHHALMCFDSDGSSVWKGPTT
ncbi:MAG: hypothetical protein ACI8S6_002736 [Myxococcota bacterium]|jgi:hypothetical protein